MKIRKAFKFRIYPNQEQRDSLAVQFGHARFVYNAGLTARKSAYSDTGQGINYNDTAWLLKLWKAGLPWLKEADSQVLQQKLKDLDRAYKNFFEVRAGYPKFKSKHQAQSIRYPQRFKVEGSKIYLPKVGWVRTILHRPLEGKMKNCTVLKTKTGKYFVSIQCEPGDLIIRTPDREQLKLTKPYLLVLHPPSGRSVVYNRKYEMLFEDASDELVEYVQKNNTQVRTGFSLTYPEQQPSWMSEEMKEQCIKYHAYNDRSHTSDIRRIPNR